MAKDPYPVSYPLSLEPQAKSDFSAREDFIRKVRSVDALNPRHPRTGFAILPREEKVRFRQIPHLHFAPSTLGKSESRFDESSNRTFEEVMIYFMGLLGVNGPLPTVFSDVVIAKAKGVPHPDMEDLHGTDSAFRADAGPAAFIDLFNHRFISFFYRAAVSSNKAVDFDRPSESRFHAFIGSFLGLGVPSTQHRMDIPDTAALYFSGHYACPTKHAEGLCSMIADFTGTKVEIEENIGHWVEVPAANHTKLGANRQAGRLGQGTMLGSRYWDRTMKFRLILGPLSWDGYQDYPPSGMLVKALKSMILLYCGREFICEINPVLRKSEVPDCVLGRGSRLGFSSWIKSTPPAADAADYRLTVIS
jgi:type VI secretion system protein ImpH